MTVLLYNHIIFDLDGTISDSRKGIYNATIHMAEKLGLEEPTPKQLAELIGPPLQQGINRVFGLVGEKADLAVKTFREYYSDKGIFENELYPGISMLLYELVEKDVQLYVATSKLETYAKRVLHYFNILAYFVDVAGADYNGLKGDKESLVLSLFQRNGISDPDRVVLVGDSKYDIDAANAIGIESIGVAWGFNSYDDMMGYNPDYIVRDINELRRLLIGDT